MTADGLTSQRDSAAAAMFCSSLGKVRPQRQEGGNMTQHREAVLCSVSIHTEDAAPYYGYRNPYYKLNTVWWPSQVYNGNHYTHKTASSWWVADQVMDMADILYHACCCPYYLHGRWSSCIIDTTAQPKWYAHGLLCCAVTLVIITYTFTFSFSFAIIQYAHCHDGDPKKR